MKHTRITEIPERQVNAALAATVSIVAILSVVGVIVSRNLRKR